MFLLDFCVTFAVLVSGFCLLFKVTSITTNESILQAVLILATIAAFVVAYMNMSGQNIEVAKPTSNESYKNHYSEY